MCSVKLQASSAKFATCDPMSYFFAGAGKENDNYCTRVNEIEKNMAHDMAIGLVDIQ